MFLTMATLLEAQPLERMKIERTFLVRVVFCILENDLLWILAVAPRALDPICLMYISLH